MTLELEIKEVRGKLVLQVPRLGRALTLHEALTVLGFEAGERVMLMLKADYMVKVSPA